MSDTIDTPTTTGPEAPGLPPATDGAAPEPEGGASLVPLALMVGAIVALGLLVNWWLVAIILALVVSILLHELGHYVVARRSGMQVTEFFLGMGPRVWSYWRGETEYGIKAFPVGAYVRITGMSNLEEVPPEIEGRSYRAQSYPKRLATVLAGPAMNLLIAFVVIYGVFVASGPIDLSADEPGDGWTVGRVVEGSAAAEAGLQEGDELVSIGGQDVADWGGFSDLVDELAGQPAEIVAVRDGETVTLPATLGWSLTEPAANLIPSSPPLTEGTRVLTVDGRPIDSYDELQVALADVGDTPVVLGLEQGLTALRLEVLEPVALPAEGDRGFFGVGPERPEPESVGVLGAVPAAATAMWDQTTATVGGLGELFSPSGLADYTGLVVDSTTEGSGASAPDAPPLQEVEADGQGSPVYAPPTEPRPISILGIAGIGASVGESQGLLSVLLLLASVNLVLALINLVPLLPFDGGHAAVATYEAVRGAIAHKPYRVDMAKLMPLTYAVVVVLLFIGLTSMWLDVRNPIQLP